MPDAPDADASAPLDVLTATELARSTAASYLRDEPDLEVVIRNARYVLAQLERVFTRLDLGISDDSTARAVQGDLGRRSVTAAAGCLALAARLELTVNRERFLAQVRGDATQH